jgi:hypothetical protein
MKRCRHCREGQVTRPRGLCWACYYMPGVRAMYPSASKFAGHGVEDFFGRITQPPFPTSALPGTPEKIAILAQRAGLGQELWHPDDALLDRRLVPKQVG